MQMYNLLQQAPQEIEPPKQNKSRELHLKTAISAKIILVVAIPFTPETSNSAATDIRLLFSVIRNEAKTEVQIKIQTTIDRLSFMF